MVKQQGNSIYKLNLVISLFAVCLYISASFHKVIEIVVHSSDVHITFLFIKYFTYMIS